MAIALRLLVSLFRFARVISFSARRWASFALGQVVWMDSCFTRDVTRLRSRACRCAESRLRCRYLTRPPAMLSVFVRSGVGFGYWFFSVARIGKGYGEGNGNMDTKVQSST